MQTKLITLVVSLQVSPDVMRFPWKALPSHIQTQLTQHGDPLRWAITSIDAASQTAQVEAVVTLNP
jgi:hypothetical protein